MTITSKFNILCLYNRQLHLLRKRHPAAEAAYPIGVKTRLVRTDARGRLEASTLCLVDKHFAPQIQEREKPRSYAHNVCDQKVCLVRH